MVREVNIYDAAQICDIYNYYIENTTITFELTPICIIEMETRIKDIVEARYPYYVYVENDIVVGFIYLNKWNYRSAYSSTAELSIYIDKSFTGNSIGTKMMNKLFEVIDYSKIHAIVSTITLPNNPSVAMHEKFGFKQVSKFTEVGSKFGNWQDVGHWQLILRTP